MTAAVDIGPDTAAEQVFAGVAVRTTPTGRSQDRAPRLTLVAATPASTAAQRATGAGVPLSASTGVPLSASTGVPLSAPTAGVLLQAATAVVRVPPNVPVRAGDDPAGPAPVRPERPRMRLVPAPPPARRPVSAAPLGGPPPTLAERIRVLRADDRSLEADELDERGAPPTVDPMLVARRLAGASVEVIVGRRPAAQLARWLAPGVLDVLRARATLTRHAATPAATRAPAVRGVRVCALHEHLVEATAVVDDGRRVRAIALRLETHRGGWRATALEIG